ncbi:MAG: hypothetical protein AB8H86_18500 [Polyangiales bacterium]
MTNGSIAFWGDRDKLSDTTEVRCKGNWLASRPRFVRERLGESGVTRVTERLAPEERALFLNPPLSFTWSPIRHLYAIDEIIFEEVMGGKVEGMVDFGEAIASYDINILYRAFFRMGSPEFFLARSHLIFNQYMSAGNVRTTTRKGHAETRLSEVVIPRYLCRFGIAGYMRGAIKAAGGKAIEVVHSRCIHDGDDHCLYQSRWR